MNDRIQLNEVKSDERWDAYLNADPVKHVQAIEFENKDDWTVGGHVGVPLVNIAGIIGTICADNVDKYTSGFLCRKLGGDWASAEFENEDPDAPVSHFNETLIGYPVLLNNVQCIEGATSFEDCTSGPMGFEHCDSQQDLKLGCGWGFPSE